MDQKTGKIALEEHFALPDTVGTSERYFHPEVWPKMPQRLIDIH
jgi:2,3-dihydroxybenzoate decarboxylase